MALDRATGQSRFRRGDEMDVNHILTINDNMGEGHSWGTETERRKASLLSRHFMGKTPGKVA